MKHNNLENQNNQSDSKRSVPVTIGECVVQLVFAEKNNLEIPEIVGNILKGAYLQHGRA